MRRIGTVSRGIRLPVIVEGDDIVSIVSNAILEASQSPYEPFAIRDQDVVGVTESLLARSQGNYVTLDDIAVDIGGKFPEGDVVVLFPIMSRNRFLPILRGIARGVQGNVHVVFSYPADEVGNQLIPPALYYDRMGTLPAQSFGEKAFYEHFGEFKHPFTGIDYIQLYDGVSPGRVVCHFSNDPHYALTIAKNILVASIHTRSLHKDILKMAGANVYGLDEVCSWPVREGAGFNPDYGLLGSNYTSDEKIKLFPRDAAEFVKKLQAALKERTGKSVEALVYGDGAFKDPVCGIWELADPVVSPGFTDGLAGTPKEIKFKYVADNATGDDRTAAVIEAIKNKAAISELSEKAALGTTPRQLTDLIGSLCDLTSGSGDKGTPVVYISGYFDSYIAE